MMLDSKTSGHDVIEIGRGAARFAGADSPVTQAYGLGHLGAEANLSALEEFYAGRAQNWELIVTPFANPEFLNQVHGRGYVPHHFETAMVQPGTDVQIDVPYGIKVEEVDALDPLWNRVAEAGWGELTDLPDEPGELSSMIQSTPNIRCYLAILNGEPAAAAGMIQSRGVCLMAGASTRPQFRGNGLQRALTQRRLHDAGMGGIAQVVTLPGSISHRNAQRMGFQPLYSKMVFMRRPD